MNKIATPQDLLGGLQEILDYCQTHQPSRAVVASKLQELADRVAKKFKYTDEWLVTVLKNPHGTYRGFGGLKEELFKAAKERGLYVTSVTPSNEVIAELKEYLNKKGVKTAASNKKFDQYIALATDDVKNLRKSDVYRVLSEAKSAKELSALAAYIIEKNSTLRTTVTDDVKDVKDEKGWG